MKTACTAILAAAMAVSSVGLARPLPGPQLAARLADGPEIIGIVHWGLNTYTDREWGFGDEDPAMLNPAKFDADQIVGACKAGKGLSFTIVPQFLGNSRSCSTYLLSEQCPTIGIISKLRIVQVSVKRSHISPS